MSIRRYIMKRGILKILGISLMLMMLATTLSFADVGTDPDPEETTAFGFRPFETEALQLSEEQKDAISKNITSSVKLRAEKSFLSLNSENGLISSPAENDCYGLAEELAFDISVNDSYTNTYTSPVILIYNSKDQLVDSFEGNSAADAGGWTNYQGSVKLHLSKYITGTYTFWLVNWPCNSNGVLDKAFADRWFDECEWSWTRFYVGPYGKPTILSTLSNTAQKTNDVIWDKSNVKGEDRYEINWRARGLDYWASRTVGVTTRGTTSGLTIGQLYEIRVRPMYGGIGGKWSDTVYRYFHTPEKIRLKSDSKGSFTMSWQKNPEATGYQVMYSTNSNGAGAAQNINNVGASHTSFTKHGLESGTTYYVQVREIRRVGETNYIGNISCPVAVTVK